MIFTSGKYGAGTNDLRLYIGLYLSRRVKYVRLYYRPGDDFLRNKGDIWVFPAYKFGKRCLYKSWVKRVSLKYRGRDQIIIQSVITGLGHSKKVQELLTSNMHVERKMSPRRRYLFLSKVH